MSDGGMNLRDAIAEEIGIWIAQSCSDDPAELADGILALLAARDDICIGSSLRSESRSTRSAR